MSDRFDWIKEKFAELLPGGMAEAVRSDLRGAEQLLDGAQVQRKDYEDQKPEAEQVEDKPAETAADTTPEAGDIAAQVADKLTESVSASVGGDFSQLTEDKLRALLIAEMSPPAEQTEAEAPPPSSDPGAAQTVEDKSASPSPSAAVTSEEEVKALFKSLLQQTEDQGQIAKALMAQADQIAALDAEIKSLAPTVQQVIELKAQIERLTAQRPRASDSEDTVLTEDAESKALSDAIKKGLEAPHPKFMGIPVKDMPK